MNRWFANVLSLSTAQFWRHQHANWKAKRFDRKFGVETISKVAVSDICDVDSALAAHAVHYEPSALPKFQSAFRAVELDYARYSFVDYGSGKGRVLLLAAQYPFRRVIGVEMSQMLIDAAAANIAAYEKRAHLTAPIELVCADARQFRVPDGNIVAYFYNPFDEVILREVWDSLRRACASQRRSLVVMYVNPVHREVFDNAAELRCMSEQKALAVYVMGDR